MRYEALFTLKGRFYGGESGPARANGCECAGEFSPVIVIHGGTSGLDLTKEEFKIREEPMKKALLAGQAVLEKDGSAMDAVTAAIMVLEDDPNFNAGKGAVFTADGFNELDASIMDGSTKKAGAVAMARHIKNPILGARLMMDKTWHTLVAGEGADKLAKENGLEMVDQKYFFTQFRYDALQKAKEKQKLLLDSEKAKKTSLNLYERPYLGTVGAVALDKNGNLAAATSTGGMINKITGRIGAYQKGSDKELDLAISKKEFIDNFPKQDAEEGFSFEQTQELLGGIN